MKLCEIYETTPPNEYNRDEIRLGKKAKQLIDFKRTNDPSHAYVGSGSYAYAYTDDDANFGDVTRIGDTLSTWTDFGYLYLEWVFKNKLWEDNLFFPRVSSIATDNNITFVVSERLLPYGTSAIVDNSKLMRAIYNRLFNVFASDSSNFRAVIPQALRYIAREQEWGDIKEPKLAEALQMIKKQFPDSNWDLHAGNLMWRMTAYQPHLVLNDPIN